MCGMTRIPWHHGLLSKNRHDPALWHSIVPKQQSQHATRDAHVELTWGSANWANQSAAAAAHSLLRCASSAMAMRPRERIKSATARISSGEMKMNCAQLGPGGVYRAGGQGYQRGNGRSRACSHSLLTS